MPIYGYQCQACGHEFELMQKMSDPAPSACPACGKLDVRKQLSAAGFQLKGSGWYATDFKGGSKKAADKDSSDSGPTGGGCGGGTCGGCVS
jgi:putative FmdB family regulatory protein